MVRVWFMSWLLVMVGGCAKSLEAPCRNFGKSCAQYPINAVSDDLENKNGKL